MWKNTKFFNVGGQKLEITVPNSILWKRKSAKRIWKKNMADYISHRTEQSICNRKSACAVDVRLKARMTESKQCFFRPHLPSINTTTPSYSTQHTATWNGYSINTEMSLNQTCYWVGHIYTFYGILLFKTRSCLCFVYRKRKFNGIEKKKDISLKRTNSRWC